MKKYCFNEKMFKPTKNMYFNNVFAIEFFFVLSSLIKF